MKIVFAGTPAFAAPALTALIRSHHEVALVVTQPDRPAGRGRHAHAPPVKTTAAAHNVPIIQPASVNQPEAIDIISGIAPDAIVVVAYGRKFGRRILSLPKFGCFNIHASLLPRYRGAAPIQHAILNGEQQSGVTIQRMAPEIDTGAIVAQQAAYIYDDDTSGELSQRLSVLAAEMIVPALDSIENGTADEIPQDTARATQAPKLRKADGHVRWKQSGADVCNFIRAMIPWPGAFTFHASSASGERRRLILLQAKPGPERRTRRRKRMSGSVPGKVVIADRELAIATADGLVSLLRVIPEGGRPMSANAYLRGHAVAVGDWLRGPE